MLCSDHPLRREAEALFAVPLKLDRGSALYYVPGIERAPETRLFHIQILQDGAHAAPRHEAMFLFFKWAEAKTDAGALARDLVRFAGHPSTPQEMALFVLGVKQMELSAAPMLWLQYDKRIRQLAAEALRTGEGGGALPACWCAMALATQGAKAGPNR